MWLHADALALQPSGRKLTNNARAIEYKLNSQFRLMKLFSIFNFVDCFSPANCIYLYTHTNPATPQSRAYASQCKLKTKNQMPQR